MPVVRLVSPKLKLFVDGRKSVFKKLTNEIPKNRSVIWFHCASLGEYEQGVPVMEALKKAYPQYALLVTFFSPSGYEQKKKNALADVVTYLPLDTVKNAKQFVKIVNPVVAIFVKYEFWPNYFKALDNINSPILSISTVFRKNQLFFKWYGGFMKEALQSVNHFFVQDGQSKELIESEGFTNVTLSGDTRFDRVARQIEQDNNVNFISDFINERLCVVIGSSWLEDENVFVDYMNTTSHDVCFVVAPHEIKQNNIKRLQQKLNVKSVTYSAKEGENLKDFRVFILDTIGYLSKVYSYSDIAYVGGAMGDTGLHNILEPATFGVPIIIGNKFENFNEAKQLQKLAGLYAVSSSVEFNKLMDKFILDKNYRSKTGMISGHFVSSNTGATKMILEYFNSKILNEN